MNEFERAYNVGKTLCIIALENSKDKPIIVVCAMGNQARGTANAMSKAGFSKVSVLKGGMNAWQSASLPISK